MRLVAVSGPLERASAAQVRALATAATAHDGVEPLGEQTLLDLDAPQAWHLLATDGPVVGYAQLGPDRGGQRPAELVVAPDARGAGLGTRLLAGLVAEAGPPLRLWAHGSLPAAGVLARRAGLVPVRELWRMARDLADPPTPTPVPGVTVRGFRPGADETGWLALNAAAFADHPEQGRLGLADLLAREAEPWFEPADLLLAERDGVLVGFAWTKVLGPVGELYVLAVAPSAQGAGLGRRLTASALAHLAARGAHRAVLFTDADNSPAVRAYVAAGFAVDRADTQFAPA